MKIIQILAVSSLTIMLVACGGGGTEVTAAAPAGPNAGVLPVTQAAFIDKYIGVWTTACLDNGGNESGKFVSTISKKSDSALTYALTATRVTGTNCTGTPLPKIFPDVTNDITYVDTVGGVDRFSYSNNGKSALKIIGSTLHVGNDLRLDPAGYPVVDINDPDTSFIKN